jgi:putative DNA primase/helicase
LSRPFRLAAAAEPGLQHLAAAAELSLNADIIRLAALAPAEYERQRIAAARRHGLPRVAFLDAAVKAARAEAEAMAAEEDEDEAPHPESVAELAPVLDEALAELQRYVVAAEPDLAAAVLWSLHAHLVHHDKVWLAVSPRLAIQAPDRNCGKSTLLEAIGALVPRPTTGSSVTASVVFRLIEALRTLKRKFARWSADLVRLPEPPLPPGLHNRSGDKLAGPTQSGGARR